MTESTTPLPILVRQFLLGRTEGLAAPQVAAFISGWTSALELLRRTDLLLPGASQEMRAAMALLLDELDRAQDVALADP